MEFKTPFNDLLQRPRPPRAATLLYAAPLALALLAGGCAQKVAKTTPPVLVPSIESAPEPVPATPEIATEPEAAPAPIEETTPASAPPAQKPKSKPRKPAARKPPVVVEAPKPEQAAQPEPSHTAPDNSVQITAAVPASAMQSQKVNTEQLLRTSQSKLQGVTRSLNENERAMASQARDYIAQSNEAMQQGEIERAYNLAVKASLLADELAK